jgi:hypothetical protein
MQIESVEIEEGIRTASGFGLTGYDIGKHGDPLLKSELTAWCFLSNRPSSNIAER